MDLREVLAQVVHQAVGEHVCNCDVLPDDIDYRVADAVLARLSQPDVLDEFERRVNARGFGKSEWCWATAEEARRVLSDMLGGES